MKKTLIIIDLQNDYFPGGAMELSNIDKAGANARKILEKFREKQWPVIHIQHVSIQEGAFFFLPETSGVKINSCVNPLPEETVIQKHFPNSFRGTTLHEHLQTNGLKDLVLCGAMSHMCVDATVRAAFDYGYQCTVADDACTTLDLAFGESKIPVDFVHGAFMAALQSVYASVVTTENLIGSLK